MHAFIVILIISNLIHFTYLNIFIIYLIIIYNFIITFVTTSKALILDFLSNLIAQCLIELILHSNLIILELM